MHVQTETSYSDILSWFDSFDRAVVAFSGGVDSTLVLFAALNALGKEHVVAVTADSPSLSRKDLDLTEELASQFGAVHVIIKTKELSNPSYVRNDSNRCYHCKHELFSFLKSEAKNLLLSKLPTVTNTRIVLLDGTNADDVSDHRPGQRAAAESGIRHPLLELGISKTAVRRLARIYSIPNWNKPEAACLASRIQRNLSVTKERLRIVEDAEQRLRKLGLKHFRVRYHEIPSPRLITFARIEVSEDEFAKFSETTFRTEIAKQLHNSGFTYVALDLEGYRKSGLVHLT